jgi:hypothetical protein
MRRPWEGLHGAWAGQIAAQLNEGILPPDYFAMPLVKVEARVEVDVGSFQEACSENRPNGSVATATWAPPRPTVALPVDFAELDVYEVQIREEVGGPILRAAIELVSPANKDRPANRHAFAVKCASYLQSGVSVVIVDVVTARMANLHADVLQLLRLGATPLWESPTHLAALAYRVRPNSGQNQLEAWLEPLSIGAALPTLPLWLDAEIAVPLTLEESYRATCSALRITD